MIDTCDVAIIGAGPAGAVAAASLAARGWRVEVFERATFPRFSIGESLLPQSMAFIEEAGLLPDIQAAGFQPKDGAAFRRGATGQSIDFADMTAVGWTSTYQVLRSRFDDLMAQGAARFGARIHFGQEVTALRRRHGTSWLELADGKGDRREVSAHLVMDASGFGRVLARLLDLERPSSLPPRLSLFCHLTDHIRDALFDRNKILISVHPADPRIWYWLIPFSDGVSSVGVVGPVEAIEAAGRDDAARHMNLVSASGWMGDLLATAIPVRAVSRLSGYSAAVSSMSGPGWVLLGNAAEFLDPIFSSGVTIALKSASLASALADRQLSGEAVDWDRDYAKPLYRGIDTFRAFVSAWYTGELQRIILSDAPRSAGMRRMIVSILAGYAWDEENPFVRNPDRYLRLVSALC